MIQTEPAMFTKSLPIYTVTDIDKAAGVVTLSGPNGSSQQAPLDAWGPFPEGHPVIGSRVQLLPDGK
jgi:hypothetical protein